jgi:hypothetical protein
MKKKDATVPDNMAESTTEAVANPESKKPNLFNIWSRLAKYDIVVPYENVITNIIFKYYLLLNSFFSVFE